MPVSDKTTRPGTRLAVIAEALFLANLLVLPGIAFILLMLLYVHRRKEVSGLALAHLSQTVSASLWGGVLLVVINLLIIMMGGYQGVHTWIIVIIYFTLCHSTLVLLGAYGLSKAIAGQCWRYPLIGRPLPSECRQKVMMTGAT